MQLRLLVWSEHGVVQYLRCFPGWTEVATTRGFCPHVPGASPAELQSIREAAAQLLQAAGATVAPDAASADVFFVPEPAAVPQWVSYHAVLGGGVIRNLRGKCLAYQPGVAIRRWFFQSAQFQMQEPEVAAAIHERTSGANSSWLHVEDRDRFLQMARTRQRWETQSFLPWMLGTRMSWVWR